MLKKLTDKILQGIRATFNEPVTQYTLIVTSIISTLVIVESIYDNFVPDTSRYMRFLSPADKQLVLSFVEWFGVLYGFLLPAILVRVWEQFDKIDSMFDREADAIKILMGDLNLLHSQYDQFRGKVLKKLKKYTINVIDYIEYRKTHNQEGKDGDKILSDIRKVYLKFFRQQPEEIQETDVLISELLTQLNNIIDYRGDRISLLTQRLFESLKFVAVLTSIVWLVPFYFLNFQDPESFDYLPLGIFGWMLVMVVTFLIIIILTIIHDLDSPFDGYWRINKKSWSDLALELRKNTSPRISAETKYKYLSTIRNCSKNHQNRKLHKKLIRLRRYPSTVH